MNASVQPRPWALALLVSALLAACGGGVDEKKEEAALLGRPGRTITVGRRMETASRKPLRLASCSSSSAAAFCAP